MNDEVREIFRSAAERYWWLYEEGELHLALEEGDLEPLGRSRFRQICLDAIVEGVERLLSTLDDPDPLSWAFARALWETEIVEETVRDRALEVFPRLAHYSFSGVSNERYEVGGDFELFAREVDWAHDVGGGFAVYWFQEGLERELDQGTRTIRFRRATEAPFGCFSNFSHHAVVIDGVEWPTTEHYYQAMKFPHAPGLQRSMREAPRPGSAKRIAYKCGVDWRPDWEDVQVEVMLGALRAKFSQHPRLAKVLLLTEEDELVEHAPRDRFWGDGGDGTGENVLGKLLMQVREELRDEDGVDRPSAET